VGLLVGEPGVGKDRRPAVHVNLVAACVMQPRPISSRSPQR
jgi:hypothetical protein